MTRHIRIYCESGFGWSAWKFAVTDADGCTWSKSFSSREACDKALTEFVREPNQPEDTKV